MNAEVALEMGFARELLRADGAFEQHVGRHVHHLDMHLENVLILKERWCGLLKTFMEES